MLDPLSIDVTGREQVAHVTTKRGNVRQWTELGIWYVPAADGRAFVARIEGHSTVPGHEMRQRAVYVGSTARALKFFDNSDLLTSLSLQAEDWMERNHGRVAGDLARLRDDETKPELDAEWFDKAERCPRGYLGTTLLQAVSWLYGDAQAGKAARLAEDFGVPRRTVADALDKEQSGQPLSGWAKAFVTALRYFDRDQFLATRGAN